MSKRKFQFLLAVLLIGSVLLAACAPAAVEVEVSLLFRRAFIALMEQKGWQVPDIVMAQQTITMK